MGLKPSTVNTDGKKEYNIAFAEANWGRKVRKWVETIQLLKADHWSRIQNSAVDIFAASMGELETSSGEDDVNNNPRLMIGLDD